MELWLFAVLVFCVLAVIGARKWSKKTSAADVLLANGAIPSLPADSIEPQSVPQVSYAFVDLETTGLDPITDRITEICVFVVTPGQTSHDGKCTLVNPGITIPARVVELTGITDDMVRNEATEECLHEYFDFIADCQVFAYNAEFDMGFLRAAALRLGRSFPNEQYCVLERLRRQHPNLKSYKLGKACDAFGITVMGDAHRAAGDVERALLLWNALNKGQMPSSEFIRVSYADEDHTVYGHFNPEGDCFFVWTARDDQPQIPDNNALWSFYVEEILKGQYEVQVLDEGLSFEEAKVFKGKILKKHALTLLNRANPWRKVHSREMELYHELTKEIEAALAGAKSLEKTDPEAALVNHKATLQLAEEQVSLQVEGGLFGEVSLALNQRSNCGRMIKVLDRITLLLCKGKQHREADSIVTDFLYRHPHARNISDTRKILKRVSKGLAEVA